MDVGFSAPISSPLVPRRVIEILDRTFRIYRANFIGFIAIAATFMIPLTIVTTLLTQNYVNDVRRFGLRAGYPTSYWVLIIASIIGQYIASIVINSVTAYIAAENHLGRQPTIAEAFREVRPRMGTLALGLFVFGLLLGACFFLAAFTGSLCFVPLLALPIIGYLGLTGYFYLTPVLVLEEVSAGLGINRAIALGKARFWPTFGLYILVTIIVFCIGFLLGLLNAFFPTPAYMSLTVNLAQVVIQTIAGILTMPIMTIALTLMYFDTRVRVEGLDIALESVDRPEPRVSDVFSPASTTPLITWPDVGNAFILTVGFVILSFALGLTGLTFLNNFMGLQ